MTDRKEEVHELANMIKKGRILEVFEVLVKNILYEIEILASSDFNLHSDDLKEILNKIDEKNDLYSQTIYNQLINDIFLPVKKIDFLRVYEAFEIIMDKVQRVGHRIGLVSLRTWIVEHQKKMLTILLDIYKALDDWFISVENKKYTIDLNLINSLENKADNLHREFLERLYSEEPIEFKEFNQAEFIDLTLEDIIDESEKLAERLYTIILDFKESNEDLPVYLD